MGKNKGLLKNKKSSIKYRSFADVKKEMDERNKESDDYHEPTEEEIRKYYGYPDPDDLYHIEIDENDYPSVKRRKRILNKLTNRDVSDHTEKYVNAFIYHVEHFPLHVDNLLEEQSFFDFVSNFWYYPAKDAMRYTMNEYEAEDYYLLSNRLSAIYLYYEQSRRFIYSLEEKTKRISELKLRVYKKRIEASDKDEEVKSHTYTYGHNSIALKNNTYVMYYEQLFHQSMIIMLTNFLEASLQELLNNYVNKKTQEEYREYVKRKYKYQPKKIKYYLDLLRFFKDGPELDIPLEDETEKVIYGLIDIRNRMVHDGQYVSLLRQRNIRRKIEEENGYYVDVMNEDGTPERIFVAGEPVTEEERQYLDRVFGPNIPDITHSMFISYFHHIGKLLRAIEAGATKRNKWAREQMKKMSYDWLSDIEDLTVNL